MEALSDEFEKGSVIFWPAFISHANGSMQVVPSNQMWLALLDCWPRSQRVASTTQSTVSCVRPKSEHIKR